MNNLKRQTDKLLDEAKDDLVEVIVQMESKRAEPVKLARAAGEALGRRRLSLSPRDLLPRAYASPAPQQLPKTETASMHALMGKATQDALGLAQIQKIGNSPIRTLEKNAVVKRVLDRMTAPAKKSLSPRPRPGGFWTSSSILLTMTKDELRELTSESPEIRSVSPNQRLTLPPTKEAAPLGIETSEILACTWGLDRTRALSVWGAYGARGKGVTIGLLDTGVDISHPDLAGRVANWAEFNNEGYKVAGSKAHDAGEHGTHCAGTLVGGSKSGRFIGMAPEAKLAAALVLNGEQGGTHAQILKAIDWVAEAKVDVISMSLGGLVMDAETPPLYTEAILTCLQLGIPVVAAIGNEGHQTTTSPGNDLFALSVGAVDHENRVAGFSGGRTQIIRESEFIASKSLPLVYSKPDLSAPGVAVYSSVPGGSWKAFNGTSMAAPHVAGAIALLLSATTIREKEHGTSKVLLIQDLITGSVDDAGESGQDHRYGFGTLNVLRAIDLAKQRSY
jgi:subtilisin family serine protease